MAKDKRYFDVDKKPLKEGVVGPFELVCSDISDWNASGSPNKVKWDGDVPSFKTAAELYTEQLPQLEEALYRAAIAYQLTQVDINLDGVLKRAQAVVDTGAKVATDFPKCKEVADYITALWTEYYTRKAAMMAQEAYSTDFTDVGVVPHDYTACVAEVNTVLSA
jgi:hypothetical protein